MDLRDRLIAELDGLQSSDDAAAWAQKTLPAKNTLTDADAESVEARFQAKLDSFGQGVGDAWPKNDASEPSDEGRGEVEPGQTAEAPPGAGIASSDHPDGVDLADVAQADGVAGEVSRPRVAAKTIRLRDKDHRKFVSRQPCLVCGRSPAEPHHLRYAQPRALGRKVSDEFTVPVCRLHHRELHRVGDEPAWWAGLNIDPMPIAVSLWRRTRPGQQSNGSTATWAS